MTTDEHSVLANLIDQACDAEEAFSLDELEEYALTQKNLITGLDLLPGQQDLPFTQGETDDYEARD